MMPAGPHVAESVLVLVLGHLADEFGAVGAQGSDSVVDAFACKHDVPEAQRVRRCDRRFDLDQFWIAKLRQLKPPVPIRGPHHDDVDSNTFEPVDAVHPRALDWRLAFDRHTERGEKSDSGCKVVDDDADVVQSLDRHVPSMAEAVRAVQADRSRELDVVSRGNAGSGSSGAGNYRVLRRARKKGAAATGRCARGRGRFAPTLRQGSNLVQGGLRAW